MKTNLFDKVGSQITKVVQERENALKSVEDKIAKNEADKKAAEAVLKGSNIEDNYDEWIAAKSKLEFCTELGKVLDERKAIILDGDEKTIASGKELAEEVDKIMLAETAAVQKKLMAELATIDKLVADYFDTIECGNKELETIHNSCNVSVERFNGFANRACGEIGRVRDYVRKSIATFEEIGK